MCVWWRVGGSGQACKETHLSSKRLDTPCFLQSPPRLCCQGLISSAKTETHIHLYFVEPPTISVTITHLNLHLKFQILPPPTPISPIFWEQLLHLGSIPASSPVETQRARHNYFPTRLCLIGH